MLFAGLLPGAGFARPHRSLTAGCTQAEAISNEACNAVDYGKQIVHIAYQRMIGSPFDGAALSGTPATNGGTITDQADWIAKMAAGSTDPNKIVLLKNIASSEVPDADDNLIEKNDVPYGGVILLDRTRSIKGKLIYVGASTIASANKFQSLGPVRLWLVDENDWVQGGNNGIEGVTGFLGVYSRGGIGGPPNAIAFDFRWSQVQEAAFSAAKITFIKSLTNP